MKTFINWWKSALVYLASAGVGVVVETGVGVGVQESARRGAGDRELLLLAGRGL